MDILGIRIDEYTPDEALSRAKEFLAQNEPKMIFTPNPEMVVHAQKDAYFKEILNKSNLNLCDGKGIELVSSKKLHRIPGVDFMLSLCELAAKEKKSVYLLGSGQDKVIRQTKENLIKNFPNLQIVGFHRGPTISLGGEVDEEENEPILEDIILMAPDILFVAFGHGKQEKWLYEFLPQLPSVKIGMGVGGAFDFISGSVKRAPKSMQKWGLEWVWRFFRQPSRFFRIWNATGKFLWLFFVKNQKA